MKNIQANTNDLMFSCNSRFFFLTFVCLLFFSLGEQLLQHFLVILFAVVYRSIRCPNVDGASDRVAGGVLFMSIRCIKSLATPRTFTASFLLDCCGDDITQ